MNACIIFHGNEPKGALSINNHTKSKSLKRLLPAGGLLAGNVCDVSDRNSGLERADLPGCKCCFLPTLFIWVVTYLL